MMIFLAILCPYIYMLGYQKIQFKKVDSMLHNAQYDFVTLEES